MQPKTSFQCVLWVFLMLNTCTYQNSFPPATQGRSNNPERKTSPAVGWFGEVMPSGMRQGEKIGEYVWEKDGSVMVYVPSDAGTLYGFYIDKYELTIGLFKKFAAATGYQTTAEKEGWSNEWDGRRWVRTRPNWQEPMANIKNPDAYPVVYLTLADAQAYGKWAGKKVPVGTEWKRAAGESKRIPDWHKAQANRLVLVENPQKTPIYPWGKDDPGYAHCNYAPNWDRREQDGFGFLAPVGSYPAGASPYGCMDMSGNVCEWVFWQPRRDDKELPTVDSIGSVEGVSNIKANFKLCGGSWCHPAKACKLGYWTGLRGSIPNGSNCAGVRLLIRHEK